MLNEHMHFCAIKGSVIQSVWKKTQISGSIVRHLIHNHSSDDTQKHNCLGRFRRRISVASNAIQIVDNENMY